MTGLAGRAGGRQAGADDRARRRRLGGVAVHARPTGRHQLRAHSTRRSPVADRRRGAKRPVLSLVLTSVREQIDKRDNQVTDLRSDEGRVVGRQAATRFFELDYLCTAGGPAREAHRALGDLLQLLVDHDIVPTEHVPEELRALGYPIDATLGRSPSSRGRAHLAGRAPGAADARSRHRPARHVAPSRHGATAAAPRRPATPRWRLRRRPRRGTGRSRARDASGRRCAAAS